MAKERGTLEDCISRTRHHVEPHKAQGIALEKVGFISVDIVEYRFKLIYENLEQIQKKVRKIREAAEKGDIEEILRAFKEKDLEFGHNFQSSTHKPA